MADLEPVTAASRLSLLRASQKDEFFCRAFEQKLQVLLLQLRQLLLLPTSVSPRPPSTEGPSAALDRGDSPQSRGNSQESGLAAKSSGDASSKSLLLRLRRKLNFEKTSRRLEKIRAAAADLCLALQRAPLLTRSAVQFLYFLACTSGRFRQTLGEEFCELRSVGWPSESQSISAEFRKVLFSLLRALPFAAAASLASSFCKVFGFPNLPTPVVEDVSGTPTLCAVLRRLHLALFFGEGAFLHFAHRVFRKRFVNLYSAVSSGRPRVYVQLVAALLFFQAIVSARRLISETFLRRNLSWRSLAWRSQGGDAENASLKCADKECDEEGSSEDSSRERRSSSLVCLFCRSCCLTPTAAACGHIFCWSCISRWSQEQIQRRLPPVCPVCRAECRPQLLVPLIHFECSEELLAVYEQQQRLNLEEREARLRRMRERLTAERVSPGEEERVLEERESSNEGSDANTASTHSPKRSSS